MIYIFLIEKYSIWLSSHAYFIGVSFQQINSLSSFQSTQQWIACNIVTSHPMELRYIEHFSPKGDNDKPLKLEIRQHQEVVVLTELNGRT